jgi:hypothetical protein
MTWFVGIVLLCLGSIGVAADSRWIHLRVEDPDNDESIRIDVPVSMLHSILPSIDLDELDEDWLVDGGRHDGLNLRELLAAVSDAPDGDFVKIRSREEHVRVGKEDGLLIAEVDNPDEGERVRVRIPIVVVEALVSRGDDRLDLEAALEALAPYDGEELITVESDDERVRIWIDSSRYGD